MTSTLQSSHSAVLLVGHGSRDARSNEEFEQLVNIFRCRTADRVVAHGYLELATPSLDDALQSLARESQKIVLLPILFSMAGHTKHDLHLATESARRKYPAKITIAQPLGVHPIPIGIAYNRALSVQPATPAESSRTAVVVVGRGSSDPDANGDFFKTARLLGEGRDFQAVQPAFMGIAGPRVEEALDAVVRGRPDNVIVVPYLLFAGRLLQRLQEQVDAFASKHSWIRFRVAGHLGPDPKLCDLLDERLQGALEGTSTLPCDNCQYRVPMPGLESNVGGLRAMLWSQRHRYTHSQAAPHVHAHRPLTKHVLVCINADCAARGSIALVRNLRREIEQAGQRREIQITKTMCMGRCGEGPTVAVYPDGIWYRGVAPEDAAELVREHLLNNRLVARLVDNIMQ